MRRPCPTGGYRTKNKQTKLLFVIEVDCVLCQTAEDEEDEEYLNITTAAGH
jgi:hypothetical protein